METYCALPFSSSFYTANLQQEWWGGGSSIWNWRYLSAFIKCFRFIFSVNSWTMFGVKLCILRMMLLVKFAKTVWIFIFDWLNFLITLPKKGITQCKLDKLYKKECSKIVTNNYRSFECGKNHIRKGFFTNSVLRQFGVTLCRGNVDSPIAAFSLSLSKCLLQNVWALCTLRCAALSFAGKVWFQSCYSSFVHLQ